MTAVRPSMAGCRRVRLVEEIGGRLTVPPVSLNLL